jgi:hypothetical protein
MGELTGSLQESVKKPSLDGRRKIAAKMDELWARGYDHGLG